MEYRSHKRNRSRREPVFMTELCDIFKKRNDEIFLGNSGPAVQPSTSSKPSTIEQLKREHNRSSKSYAVNEMTTSLDCVSSQELPKGKRVNLMKQKSSQYQRNDKHGMSKNEVQRKIPENLQGLSHKRDDEERQQRPKIEYYRKLSPITEKLPPNQRDFSEETPQNEGQRQRGKISKKTSEKELKADKEMPKSKGRRISQIAQMSQQQRHLICQKDLQPYEKQADFRAQSRRTRESILYKESAKKEMSRDEWRRRMVASTSRKSPNKLDQSKEEGAEIHQDHATQTAQAGTSKKHSWMPKEEFSREAKRVNQIARKMSQRLRQQDQREGFGSSSQDLDNEITPNNVNIVVLVDDETQSVEFFFEM